MRAIAFVIGLGVSVAGSFSAAFAAGGKAFTDPKEAGPDFVVQGEYVGEFDKGDKGKEKWGVQVIALGEGKFHAVAYAGGLPGEGILEDGLDRLRGHHELPREGFVVHRLLS